MWNHMNWSGGSTWNGVGVGNVVFHVKHERVFQADGHGPNLRIEALVPCGTFCEADPGWVNNKL